MTTEVRQQLLLVFLDRISQYSHTHNTNHLFGTSCPHPSPTCNHDVICKSPIEGSHSCFCNTLQIKIFLPKTSTDGAGSLHRSILHTPKTRVFRTENSFCCLVPPSSDKCDDLCRLSAASVRRSRCETSTGLILYAGAGVCLDPVLGALECCDLCSSLCSDSG